MSLRRELIAPDPDPAVVDRLEQLCIEGINCVDAGRNVKMVADEVHAIIGGDKLTAFDFDSIAGSVAPRFWAEVAAIGEAPHVPDLTRDELVEVVRLVFETPPSPKTDYYLQLFSRNVSHSAPSDLICYPDHYWPEGYQPTPAEIVEKALDPANVIRL